MKLTLVFKILVTWLEIKESTLNILRIPKNYVTTAVFFVYIKKYVNLANYIQFLPILAEPSNINQYWHLSMTNFRKFHNRVVEFLSKLVFSQLQG